MSYSGNPSLSSDVKQRILSTFEQTLDLAREGNRQEALLGCDFVLRMDPQFQPAHVLQERLRATAGPVQVNDLLPGAAPAADPFGELDGLTLDLPAVLPGAGAGLRAEMESLLGQRRFQEALSLAGSQQAAVAADLELQRLAGTAQEQMEAEPYVQKFLQAARQAQQAGQADEVERLLAKARSLDAGHPGIAALESARPTAPAAPATPAAVPFGLPSPLQPAAFPARLAVGGGDSESDRRIQQLLAEGQTAYDAGDPQGAIDAWSRIFLIDIDHQEASRRIEAARKVKAETERRVEEIFHDGLSRLEAGDSGAARQAFERVLEIQPGYFAAREYLEQLDSGNMLRPKPAGFTPVSPEPPVTRQPALESQDLKEEILVPPEPGDQPAPERTPVRKKKTTAVRDTGRARRRFLVVGGVVLVLALAAAWYFLQNRDQFFPNSQPEETPASLTLPKRDPISRAERLHKSGKTDLALKQLQKIDKADPQYAAAQKLIAEWGGTPVPDATSTPAPAVAATDPAVEERRQELLAAARNAYNERTYLRALSRLEQAQALAKLGGDDARLLESTKAKLEPIAKQIDLFRQHEWDFAIRELWNLHESDPSNRDVTQLLADSYYNLGVKDLQRADAVKAAENLGQSLELQKDPAVQRNLQFAQSYGNRPKDLLYRIYVKYLPFR